MKPIHERPNWDTYFMEMARTASKRSEDPSTKVGCIITTNDNELISSGYNGFVAGCNGYGISLERPTKYGLVIHAEMNAIMFAKRGLREAKIYCTHAPCDNCLKHILQSGIRNILFDISEPLTRLPDESLQAAGLLARCVTMLRFSNINGKPYTGIITDILTKRRS